MGGEGLVWKWPDMGMAAMIPRIALALGAGGAYGFAHIGVLEVLEEQGLVPDIVVGCSAGAIIGALYCAGLRADQLVRLASSIRRGHFMDVTMTRMGIMSGQRLEGVLRLLTRDRRLEEMDPPLAIVATDIESGEPVVFTKGPAALAARASSAIPGVFHPVRVEGRLLVDGALLHRVPVRVARALGADRVIAVALGPTPAEGRVSVHNMVDVVLQSFDIMQREVVRQQLHEADVLIEPCVLGEGSPSRMRLRDYVAAGRSAARERIAETEALFGAREAAGGHA